MSHTDVVLAGRYRLESRIASGGAGEVWRGRDEVLARPVAVKLLRDGYAHRPETVAGFRSEARVAALVTHPGIAQVYDFGQAELPYLVMELVDGPSLAQVLGDGPLEPGRAMDVLAQAAEGLDAAHRAGLVHRDIKPGNLLLGSGGRVKITDFGISRAAGSVPVTRTGPLLGTPAYLAPERVAGQAATPASDLYSLGVVAWECLAGAPPFTGPPVEVAMAHRDRPLPPLPGAVPAEVAALVAELTAKDPAARPPGAGQVARRAGRIRDALNARSTLQLEIPPYLLASPAPAGRARPFGPLRGGMPPRRAALGAAGVIAAIALAVLLAVTLSRAGSEPSAASHPTAPPRTSAAATVEVSVTSLVGQPVAAVLHQLRQLGLAARVLYQPSDQDPGTVLSVQPSGRVPAGSLITVTAAASPPRHHGRGHDHGNGNGGD